MGRLGLYRATLIIAAAFLIAVTILPVMPVDAWWIRVLDFPRVQIVVLLSIVMALLAVSGRPRPWLWIGLCALAFGYQLVRVVPYLAIYPKQATTAESCPVGQSIRLLASNVLQTNRDYQRTVDIVRAEAPDVFIALEVDQPWTDALSDLDDLFAEQHLIPLDNLYGLNLYSRLPLSNVEERYVVEPDIPSIRADVRLESGAVIRLFAVHPRPPVPGKDSGARDAELVLTGREVAETDLPVIVAGDLNDVAWSDTTRLFQEVAQLLDPRVGRGYFPTFNAHYPLLRWPLDHVFFDDRFGVMDFERLPATGSDHFPILVTLCYAPSVMAAEQDEPRADADALEQADREVADGVAQQAAEMAEGEDETQIDD
ncbi:MAG: endonuclease/exonuclease/phosphatase family protein [Pacificimonas sp.]